MSEIYSKFLVVIYDKPMIYYPLSILMLAGVKDIIIVCNVEDLNLYKKAFGEGENFGIKINYVIQDKFRDEVKSLKESKQYIGDDNVLCISGDNIFYGDTFINNYVVPVVSNGITTIFSYKVKNSSGYSVLNLNKNGQFLSIEKGLHGITGNALTGLYFFNKEFLSKVYSDEDNTTLNSLLTQANVEGDLNCEPIGRGVAWLDSRTNDNMLSASLFVQSIEKRQGFKIACLEEIALRKKYIDIKTFEKISLKSKGNYGEYLREILSEEEEA